MAHIKRAQHAMFMDWMETVASDMRYNWIWTTNHRCEYATSSSLAYAVVHYLQTLGLVGS